MKSRSSYLGVKRFVCVFMAGLLCFAAGTALAQDVEALIKQAGKDISAAERRMNSSSYDEALKLIAAAEAAIAQVQATDPDHSRLKMTESSLARIKKNIERRMPKPKAVVPTETSPAPATRSTAPTSTTTAPASGSAASSGAVKAPAGVTRIIKNIDGSLASARNELAKENSVLSKEHTVKQANYKLSGARDGLAEIEDKIGKGWYEIPLDHPDLEAVRERIAAVQKEVDAFAGDVAEAAAQAESAKAAGEAASAEWLAKIGPYVTSSYQEGHDPEKYFIASGTSNPEELMGRMHLYNEAKALYEDYMQNGPKSDKTYELEQAEEALRRAVEEFPKAFESSAGEMLAKAEELLGQERGMLEKDDAWRSDPNEKPYTLNADRIGAVKNLIDIVAAVMADSPKVAEMRKGLAALIASNDERRTANIGRTLMIADKFSGGDIGDLKAKAGAVVKEDFANASVLRTTVISEDWKEESVDEWTDSTRTARRHRVTRSVSAQVAAKRGGETLLYTIYIAKDRRTDGTWGALKGHVMFTDSMLEENVNKNAP